MKTDLKLHTESLKLAVWLDPLPWI